MGRLRASLHIFRRIVFSLWDAVNPLLELVVLVVHPRPAGMQIPHILWPTLYRYSMPHDLNADILSAVLTSGVWQDKKYLNISRQVP